eukprot:8535454-Karenia_brevis.AAC.1
MMMVVVVTVMLMMMVIIPKWWETLSVCRVLPSLPGHMNIGYDNDDGDDDADDDDGDFRVGTPVGLQGLVFALQK